MALADREFEIATGRRTTDAHVNISVFAGSMLVLTVENYGERTPTLLLTRDQALQLQNALAQLIPILQEPEPEESNVVEIWEGRERRTSGKLR